MDLPECQLAQALVVVRALQQREPLPEMQRVVRWLADNGQTEAAEVFRLLDRWAEKPAMRRVDELAHKLLSTCDGGTDPVECLTALLQPQRRKSLGVYYTPRPLADYVASCVEHKLRSTCQLPLGFADESTWESLLGRGMAEPENGLDAASKRLPFVRVLDPAVGSGVFPCALIRRARAAFSGTGRRSGLADDRRWEDFVTASLLHRLWGFDLMPVALAAAHWNIAHTLWQTGFRFRGSAPLHLYRRNTLHCLGPAAIADKTTDNLFTVVMGNPPFGALTRDYPPPMQQLMRGLAPGAAGQKSYFETNGQALSERKTWLHDLYVQFFRLAHWTIDRAGCGVVGLVTNHGYLDNLTFRAMRFQLLNSFAEIEVTDLSPEPNGANRKTLQQSPFGIATGTSVTVLCKGTQRDGRGRVSYRSICPRSRALDTIRQWTSAAGNTRTNAKLLLPAPPNYLFSPRKQGPEGEFMRGISITRLMPAYGSVVVTARDWLVTASGPDELARRLACFRDRRKTTDWLRSQFKFSTRSTRYPPGDSRGWKLDDARRRLMADRNWRQRIRTCKYRPLDDRYIFWADYMIDWPREKITRHLEGPGNIALIVRRQSPPDRPCNYFWVADAPAIDGILRSDNRGNEYVFPLWLRAAGRQCANFDRQGADQIRKRWQIRSANGSTGDDPLARPQSWLGYIYALFHSSEYQQRYAPQLCTDFPRILFTRNRELAIQLSQLGENLLGAHLGTSVREPALAALRFARSPDSLTIRRPNWQNGSVRLDQSTVVSNVGSDVWQFKAGAHQVARKWLCDRKNKKWSPVCAAGYQTVLHSIQTALDIQRRIDITILDNGDWHTQFVR